MTHLNLDVLVVDDEAIVRQAVVRELQERGVHAEERENAEQGLQRLEGGAWDVVLTDLRMPGMGGLEFLKAIRERKPEVSIILMTAYGSTETAVAALQQGAEDYLVKPFSFEELEIRLKKLAEKRRIRQELASLENSLDGESFLPGLVGRSREIRQVYQYAQMFAKSDSPVCITGESGTGKRAIGRAIHAMSLRAGAPFVVFGCGAVPRESYESELFGIEESGTGDRALLRRGRVEQADGGTLLLQNVEAVPWEIQPKLLRLCRAGTVRRVGGEKDLTVDVRLISTSKVDLAEVAHQGLIQEDWFYRMDALEIRVPPLRERGSDLLLLAQHFLQKLAHEEGAEPKLLSDEAAALLGGYTWPGNVRELQRVIKTTLAVCAETKIGASDLPEHIRRPSPASGLFSLELGALENVDLHDLTREFEEEVIRWALKKSDGEQQRAAAILGLPRSTLQSKMSKRSKSWWMCSRPGHASELELSRLH